MNVKQSLKQFRGELYDIGSVARYNGKTPAGVNEMARRSLNYLNRNPVKERGWECKFYMYPTHIPYHCPRLPSNEYGYDVISIADTDLRMDIVYAHMRALAGVAEPSEAEEGVRRRADSYLNENHVCCTNPSACTGTSVDGIWVTVWGTAHNIIYYCDAYERTGDSAWLKRAKAALDGVLPLADETDGMRDFPAGLAPYRDGVWLKDGWMEEHWRNYTFILEPLVRYYELSGDRYYLRQAELFAEGFIGCMRDNRGEIGIDPDTGAFCGHVHLHTRAVWGMAHLGMVTHDVRYTGWAKRVFDFVVNSGADFGWYPEHIPQGELLSETCINGDMMAAAYYLAQCGHLDAYDLMERNWRNYLNFTQFSITPAFAAFYRKIHPELTERELAVCLRDLKALEGGFVAQVTWSDLTQYGKAYLAKSDAAFSMYMMGCCPPSAMLALHYIAKGAVLGCGGRVYVNMSITADTGLASLRTDYSGSEKLRVTAKAAGDYYIRVPEWADPRSTAVSLNGKPAARVWDGPQCRYLKVCGVNPGDTVSLDYALVTFKQKIRSSTLPDRTEEGVFTWVGNELVRCDPDFTYLPLIR